MRCADPPTVYRHPNMTLQHLIDGQRNESVRTNGPETSSI